MDKIEVVFLDDDETTILDKQEVNFGERVEFHGKYPEKDIINGIKYIFIGWTNEEKLKSVEENLTLVAKFAEESSLPNMEDALFNATLESTKKTNFNATITAGNRLTDQRQALEKDGRNPEEIVNEVLENGKAELGQENSKEDMER